jgi:hypothetical protein
LLNMDNGQRIEAPTDLHLFTFLIHCKSEVDPGKS